MTDDPRLTPEDELPSELAQMLRQERDIAEPGSDVAERVLGRLEQTLGLPPIGGGGSSGGGAPASPGAKAATTAAGVAGVSKAAASAAVALALGVGAVVGAAGHSALVPPPAASVEVRTIVSVVRVVEAPSALPEPTLPAPSATSSETAPSANKPKAASVPSNLVARDRALAEENALIARAQAALARGNVAQARAALQEHAGRFPNGQLQEERRLLERYTAEPKQAKP